MITSNLFFLLFLSLSPFLVSNYHFHHSTVFSIFSLFFLFLTFLYLPSLLFPFRLSNFSNNDTQTSFYFSCISFSFSPSSSPFSLFPSSLLSNIYHTQTIFQSYLHITLLTQFSLLSISFPFFALSLPAFSIIRFLTLRQDSTVLSPNITQYVILHSFLPFLSNSQLFFIRFLTFRQISQFLSPQITTCNFFFPFSVFFFLITLHTHALSSQSCVSV